MYVFVVLNRFYVSDWLRIASEIDSRQIDSNYRNPTHHEITKPQTFQAYVTIDQLLATTRKLCLI